MSAARGDGAIRAVDSIDAAPGTYVLLFGCHAARTLTVGRVGALTLVPGYYLYVGSAFGPGGVRARVARHLRRHKPRHWHLDYLCEVLVPLEAWYTLDGRRREHEFAVGLAAWPDMAGLSRFGSSDCDCASHLFACRKRPRASRLARAADLPLAVWRCSDARPGADMLRLR